MEEMRKLAVFSLGYELDNDNGSLGQVVSLLVLRLWLSLGCESCGTSLPTVVPVVGRGSLSLITTNSRLSK
jgi:hypothetical protein